MGLIYSVSRSNVALSTTTDLLTITAAAARSLRIREISIGGMGTASAANELGVQRSTGGATPVSVTPEKSNPALPTQGFTVASSWTTQPTLSGGPFLRLPVNSNGGVFRHVPPPGSEIEIAGAGQLSFRSVVGTGVVSITVVVEEF